MNLYYRSGTPLTKLMSEENSWYYPLKRKYRVPEIIVVLLLIATYDIR